MKKIILAIPIVPLLFVGCVDKEYKTITGVVESIEDVSTVWSDKISIKTETGVISLKSHQDTTDAFANSIGSKVNVTYEPDGFKIIDIEISE